jgi:riboflavin-specific deaminase-like protein
VLLTVTSNLVKYSVDENQIITTIVICYILTNRIVVHTLRAFGQHPMRIPSRFRSLLCGILCSTLSADEALSKTQILDVLVVQNIVTELRTAQKQFMPDAASPLFPRPFITAAYAQSVDGKLAAYNGKEEVETTSNFPLSGSDSLLLTHAIRASHDGVLIGGKTLSIDNPRLTNRLWDHDSLKLHAQPTSIVLDTHLNNIQSLGDSMRLKHPIICCSKEAASSCKELPSSVVLLPCRCSKNGQIDLGDMLHKLYIGYGIKSLMIEGGPTLLKSFLDDQLVDCLCITIAPKFLGSGIGVSTNKGYHLPVSTTNFYIVGKDCCMISVIR